MLDQVELALEDLRQGKGICLVDDFDRENEGDIVYAAEKITPEAINFMSQEAKGLICLSLTEQRTKELHLPLQVSDNRAVFGTNFTVSIDHRDVVDRGITAEGRARTIFHATEASARPEDFSRPGFVFPLAARPGGVFQRRGQTEGSVDLARLAGLSPAAVICEIMSSQGIMLQGTELEAFCKNHDLRLLSIEQVKQYRLHHEVSLQQEASVALEASEFKHLAHLNNSDKKVEVRVYRDLIDNLEHLAFIVGEPRDGCPVRVHSACLTGDVFGSLRCDCGQQLHNAFQHIFDQGAGVIIYLAQEGRGIGLGNKLRAYELQDQGRDTIDANTELGFDVDSRDYHSAAWMLRDLGITSLKLITNNPHKISALQVFGVEVLERIFLPSVIDEHNRAYLETKRLRMGHLLPQSAPV